MKKKIFNICNDYKEDFIKYFKKLKKNVKKFFKKVKYNFSNIKENLLKKENRKKYLTITGVLIIVNILIINIYISFGYYHNENTFSLVRAVVGNLYLDDYDYVLLVYLEETDATGNGNGNYYLTENIPSLGYNYSGYKCQNNSTLVYDDIMKITSVTTDHRDICSIYFDVVGTMDITVKIMLEESVGSDTYIISDKIPAYGYKYSYYECENDGSLEYNSDLHSVKIATKGKEYCSIYFKKESADIIVDLFVEETYQTEDYLEKFSIPTNIEYEINDSKSSCKNANNERVDATITYEDGYINVDVKEVVSCEVYLDRKNA